MVNATGTTEIWNERSTDVVGLAVTNVQELATVGVKGEITGGSSYQVGFKDSLASGTADSINIALDGATITTLGVGGMTATNEFETLNISATGTNVVTGLIQGTGAGALAATKTVNVTGAGKVTVTNALAGTVTTVDASANTGGVSFDLSATGAVKATGGAGNDTFKLGASLTTADVLVGGEGTDIIGVTTGASLVTGLQVTGFETLDIGGADNQTAANAYDVSKLSGITTLKVGAALNGTVAAQTTTVNNLAKGAGVEINAALGNAAADVLEINVKDAGAGSPNDTIGVLVKGATVITTTGQLAIKDIETVTLTADKSTATGNVAHIVSDLTADQALTVKVANGNAGLTITDLNAKALVLFDATEATQAVSVTTAGGTEFTATNGIAFKLGAGADTLDLTGSISAGTVTGSKFYVTGGAGGDTITLTATNIDPDAGGALGTIGNQETLVYLTAADSQAGQTAAGANKFDTINNFDAETVTTTTQDFIDLKALGFTGTQAAAFAKAVGTAITATGGVAAADATSFFVNAGQKAAVAVVADGGNTWLFVDADKDGNYSAETDMAIKLVAVTSTDVTSTDFIFA